MSQKLTTRESQVIALRRQGLKLVDVAEELGITTSTVKIHIKNAYQKGAERVAKRKRRPVVDGVGLAAVLLKYTLPIHLLSEIADLYPNSKTMTHDWPLMIVEEFKNDAKTT